MDSLQPVFRNMVANKHDPHVVDHMQNMVYRQVPHYCRKAGIPISFLSDPVRGKEARKLALQNTFNSMMGLGPEKLSHQFNTMADCYVKAKEQLLTQPVARLEKDIWNLRRQVIETRSDIAKDKEENLSMRINPKLENAFASAYIAARRMETTLRARADAAHAGVSNLAERLKGACAPQYRGDILVERAEKRYEEEAELTAVAERKATATAILRMSIP